MYFRVLFRISSLFPSFSRDLLLNLVPEADRNPFRFFFWRKRKTQLYTKERSVRN